MIRKRLSQHFNQLAPRRIAYGNAGSGSRKQDSLLRSQRRNKLLFCICVVVHVGLIRCVTYPRLNGAPSLFRQISVLFACFLTHAEILPVLSSKVNDRKSAIGLCRSSTG